MVWITALLVVVFFSRYITEINIAVNHKMSNHIFQKGPCVIISQPYIVYHMHVTATLFIVLSCKNKKCDVTCRIFKIVLNCIKRFYYKMSMVPLSHNAVT